MDGFAILIAIVTFIMALVALNKISSLETRIAELKLQLGNAIEELAKLLAGEVAPPSPVSHQIQTLDDRGVSIAEETAAGVPLQPVAEAVGIKEMAATIATELPEPAEPEAEAAAAMAAEPAVTVAEPEQVTASPATLPPRRARDRDMEQTLASRWFVWIGGLAIAIGGVLFVKYAYDNHLIPPAVQIVLGLIAGALLVAAGEFVRRKSGPGQEQSYVPAALSAGGIVTLFGCIYAAYALYDLIAPGTAFIGLAVVAVGALALSRLQGPFIAALGLIGSYGTPAIIPSASPSAWGLFPYLLVILVASFATLRGRVWWWLGYAAISGSTVWALLWFNGPFQLGDTLPIGLFSHAIGLIAMFGLSGLGVLGPESGNLRETPRLSPHLMIGLAGLLAEILLLAVLVTTTQHATLALAFFMAAQAMLVGLAWRKQGLDLLAPIAAVLALAILMMWPEAAFHQFAMDESGLWSSIPGPAAHEFLRWMLGTGLTLTVIGCLGARGRPDPVLWSGVGAAAAALFVFGAWARVDVLLGPTTWAVIAIALAAGLLGTASLSRGRHDLNPLANLSAGVLSIGAAILLLFAADRWFDAVWLTLAIAALALLFAVLAGVMRVSLQGSIAAAFGTLTTVRLFVSRNLWLDDRSLPLGQHWILYGYGVPAVLFLVASRFLKAAGYVRSAVSLEGLSLGLVISLVSLEIRVLIGGGVTAEHPQLLELSAHILTWLGAAYGLLYRQRLYSSFIASWGARLLLAGSAIAIFGGSLLSLNPVISRDTLQGGIVFNALLLAYLAPAILLWLIARSLASLNLEKLRPFVETLAIALLTVYLSLQLKRFYQGPILSGEPRDELEAALHVLIWLGLALLLVWRATVFLPKSVEWSGRALLGLSILAIAIGAFAVQNPVVSGRPLLGGAVFNSLLLSYLAPIGLIALISRRLDVLNLSSYRPVAGGLSLALVFAYVTLETKRLFQGPTMVPWSLSVAESYAYSAVWLVLALALFIAGLKLAKQYIRYAGLGVMVVVVLKVFLWDMSNLEGLYRIGSFIGLGLCLVGIGWLYQRFVQPRKLVSS